MVIKSKGSEARLLRLRILVFCVTLATTLTFLCCFFLVKREIKKKKLVIIAVFIL